MPDNPIGNRVIEHYAGIEGRDLVARVLRDHAGRVALLSSFGAESSVLLHMVSEVDLGVPVIFLDTEKLFPETIVYRKQLTDMLGLTDVRIVHPDPDDVERHDADGNLNRSNPDLCCNIRKTLPMNRALEGFDVLLSGRKRFHGAARSDLQFVSIESDRLKVDPLAGFTSLDLVTYMQKHHLPSHPLRLQGYRSIGCVPCTTLGGTEDNPRAGRWQGTEKTECGIHFTANGKIIRTVSRQTANA